MTKTLKDRLNGENPKESGAYHLMRLRQRDRDIAEYRLLYQVRGHKLIPYSDSQVVRYADRRLI